MVRIEGEENTRENVFAPRQGPPRLQMASKQIPTKLT
jgi:hypothetical protein